MKRQHGWNSPKEARKGGLQPLTPLPTLNHTNSIDNASTGLVEAPEALSLETLSTAYLHLIETQEVGRG